MRVLSIFGTRPEAVKMAPLVKVLEKTPGVEPVVCVTAQHRQMLDQVLRLFQITPDFDLDLMRPNQSLAELTAAILVHLDGVLKQVKPDWLLVQGDTTTVMAASLLGYYHRIRVGHVEAGLRTHDKWQPFPEEINRRISGVIADLHFAPTESARENLLREGIPDAIIKVTGNPVIDALQMVASQPYDVQSGPLAGIPWDRRVILLTAHRRENFGKPLEDICAAIRQLAEGDPSLHFVYPVHLNPNVQGPAYSLLGDLPNVTLIDPLDYQPLVYLMKHSVLVLTDSGGFQEEAPALGKPVLVMREVTERPEGVAAGTAILVGTDTNRIVTETRRLLDNPDLYQSMAQARNPYGDGHSAERIVQALLEAKPHG